jgi:hypothetical protein
MLVYFIIIGAQKSGTTSLAGQLAQHPSVCFSRVKEPGYFNRVKAWEDNLDEYHGYFDPEDGQICGEASTMYTFFPEWLNTHTKLCSYNPNLKLIYIMRNPIERIVSQYSHDFVRGLVKDSPEDVVLRNPEYINRSRYSLQIKKYYQCFPSENILLLLFEDYVQNPSETIRGIAKFLEISPTGFNDIDFSPKHQSVGPTYLKFRPLKKLRDSSLIRTILPSLSPFIRKTIRAIFYNRLESRPVFSEDLRRTLWSMLEQDVHGIEELLNEKIDSWH